MSDQGEYEERCPICLDNPMVLPIKYQCNHTFCFLCIKQHTQNNANPTCPLCRQVLDITQYDIVESAQSDSPISNYYWQYEGRNFGWWNYTKQMTQKIENTYRQYRLNQISQDEYESCDSESDNDINREKLADHQCYLEIGTSVYIVDVLNMNQYHQDYPDTQKRNIRRVTDLDKEETKGTAGLQDYYQE